MLSLFLGVSIMTLGELIELVFELIIQVVYEFIE